MRHTVVKRLRRHPGMLTALLVFPALLVGCLQLLPYRPRAVWTEDAEVVALSLDGRRLVTNGTRGIRLRDGATGRVIARLEASPSSLDGPRFSPDGRFLLAAVPSDRFKPVVVKDLNVWNAETGVLQATFPNIDEHMELPVAQSADGRMLAFPDLSDRRPVQPEKGHINLDGRDYEIARNASKGLPRVQIWDLASNRQVALVDGAPPLAMSPDGSTLATGDRDWQKPIVKLWDTATGRLRAELHDRDPGVWPLVFSPDGTLLLADGHKRKVLWRVADATRWELPGAISGAPDRPACFSRDGRWLLPYGLPRIDPSMGPSAAFACYGVSTLPPRRLETGSDEVVACPERGKIAVIHGRNWQGQPTLVRLCELESSRELWAMEVRGFLGAEFTPDGRWLVLLVAWNEPTFQPPSNGVMARLVNWFPGLFPAPGASRYNQEIRLVDPATGLVRARINPPTPIWGNPSYRFSADGKTAAVSYVRGEGSEPDISDRPHTIEIWDIPPTPSVGRALVLSMGLLAVAAGVLKLLRRLMRGRPGHPGDEVPR